MKTYPSAVPRDLNRVATTQQRKQLFGVGSSGSDDDYFVQSLQSPDMKREVNALLKSGRELLSKAKQLYYVKFEKIS